ncbi:MAG: HAD family phosphatase [Acidobacteria bacterium]|nr:MAG: HAD family phosphatase [Acidobacteriota bacterium]
MLWDLDGTLADSREFHWRAWRDTMAGAGVTITEAQFSASFGQRNDAIIPAWLGARATPAVIRHLGDAKEALYREFVTRDGIAPLPGAADWVRELDAAGWRQAIASSAPRANVELMARVLGFSAFMTALIGAEDVRHGKPAPDVFLAAAAAVGASPQQCVVVEDAAAGVEAAHRGGMACVGVGDIGVEAADVRVTSLDRLPPDVFETLVATSSRRT